MKINEVTTAIKVGEIIRVNNVNKKWSVAWIENNEKILILILINILIISIEFYLS